MKINESYMPLLKNWLYGIAFYFIPFFIGYLAFSFVISDNLLHTDVDSARYMLSALVQSEAAIVALVVTLSLVAVQLAAQSYSARVIEVFRRTPDLWILMGIYGIAVFYGLGVLKMIEKANPALNSMSNLEGQVAFSYYLGVFAFVALVPYILNTLNLLKPLTIIKILSERITKENIISSFKKMKEKSEKDPILPIIDIVRGALMKYDYETVRDGLRAIGAHSDLIFAEKNFGEDEEEDISEHIFSHLTKVGRLAASRSDETSTRMVIYILRKNGKSAAVNRLERTLMMIQKSLGEIGKTAAEYKLNDAARRAVHSLKSIGKTATEQELKDATLETVISLEEVGVAAAEQKLEGIARKVIISLEIIEKILYKQYEKSADKEKLEEIIYQIADSRGEIGIAATKKGLKNVSNRVIMSIGNAGVIAARQKLKDVTKQSISFLEAIGIVAAEQELERIVVRAVDFLKEVGKVSAEQKLTDATQNAIMSLKKVRRVAVERNLDSVEPKVKESFNIILKIATEQKLELLPNVLISLKKSRKATAKENLEELEWEKIESFEKLIKISEKQVKTTQQTVEYLEKINETLSKLKK